MPSIETLPWRRRRFRFGGLVVNLHLNTKQVNNRGNGQLPPKHTKGAYRHKNISIRGGERTCHNKIKFRRASGEDSVVSHLISSPHRPPLRLCSRTELRKRRNVIRGCGCHRGGERSPAAELASSRRCAPIAPRYTTSCATSTLGVCPR